MATEGLKTWLSYLNGETVLKHLESFRYCSTEFLYKAALQNSFLGSQNTRFFDPYRRFVRIFNSPTLRFKSSNCFHVSRAPVLI